MIASQRSRAIWPAMSSLLTSARTRDSSDTRATTVARCAMPGAQYSTMSTGRIVPSGRLGYAVQNLMMRMLIFADI
ncbi:MAG: hypothetical protein EBR82_83615 [Caulobacteraceae bacterium]|nr:hypothetical protein [Caulobacteraceae bacterium]